MPSVWADALRHSLDQSLDLLAAAVRDCPGGSWQAPMWSVPPPGPDHAFLGPDWKPITDHGERGALVRRWVERRSTPWSVAWHALEVLDYDLDGDLTPWAPPPPFTGHPHWRDLASLAAPWSPPEILGYVAYCRDRVYDTLAHMTGEQAATVLPPSHRFGGQPHLRVIAGLAGHTTEHASQIRQFVANQSTAFSPSPAQPG